MASQQSLPPPPPPPKKKKSPPPAPTTICALGDDLLREVFLCLPSLPSLVRASLTCTPFLRAVRSSPAFRRRFRDLHPPQLLGIFLNIHDPALPAFAPTRRRSDVDHAAAICGADVFFTLLPEDDKDFDPEWTIEDCRDGYVILVNWQIKKMAVYDPLTRALDLFAVPPEEVCSNISALSLSLMKGGGRKLPCSHLSSDTREWQVFPFSEDASPPDDGLGGTMVNGSVYWTFASGSNIRVLNAATLRFSEINPPLHMEGQGEFKPGETKDGKLCLVCAVKLTLVVWIWRPDDDGVDRWILDKTISLQDGLGGDVALNIVAIISGFVYFSTFSEMNQDSCLFMSYCLETEKLNKLCPVTHSYHSYPYIMGFPPSLKVAEAYFYAWKKYSMGINNVSIMPNGNSDGSQLLN
uniref:F-box protein AT5G49610-like beta-propeller domain-containing protein n=1 Tax=Aegilops tauschii TaxID=37682 RepID=M8AVC6_AEGTA